jgi:hypothetical protein
MAYLGKTPVVGTFQKIDTIAGLQNGIRTSFPITVSGTPLTPESSNQLLLIKNGVTLEPGVGFSVSNTNLNFPVAPAGTDNIFAIVYGSALYTGIPSAGSIGNDKLVDNTIGYDKLSGDTVSTIIGNIITFGI